MTGRIARWIFWSVVLATVGVVAYRNHEGARAAVGLIGSAAWWWMVPAALAIAGASGYAFLTWAFTRGGGTRTCEGARGLASVSLAKSLV